MSLSTLPSWFPASPELKWREGDVVHIDFPFDHPDYHESRYICLCGVEVPGQFAELWCDYLRPEIRSPSNYCEECVLLVLALRAEGYSLLGSSFPDEWEDDVPA